MPSYALLIRPAANRVFSGQAPALLGSELAVANQILLGERLQRIEIHLFGGLPYLSFASDEPLDRSALLAAVIANLSSGYALFESLDGGNLLRPLEMKPLDRYPGDLVTTQRYVGKTNETFTKLLVNLALFAADSAFENLVNGQRVQVLDPLCGRGTTLNQVLLYGADAFGIDADSKATSAYSVFLKGWLEEKRLKHRLEATSRQRFQVTIGRKGTTSSGDRQVVDVATADTGTAPLLFGKKSVDVLVADLPYGVQHGSRTGAGAGGLSRNPEELLASALPAWRTVVRPGGAMALSFNVRTLARSRLVAALEEASLTVCELPAGTEGFEHRVDRTITRDLVIAKRP